MNIKWDKKIKEAIAYKERGYLNIAQEIFESIPKRQKNSFAYFQEGELYLKISQRKKAEISPLQYKVILQKAKDSFKKCIRSDRGEFYRFQDKKSKIHYYTLKDLANERIKIIEREILNLKGIREKEEMKRLSPLKWSEGILLVIKPFRKKDTGRS